MLWARLGFGRGSRWVQVGRGGIPTNVCGSCAWNGLFSLARAGIVCAGDGNQSERYFHFCSLFTRDAALGSVSGTSWGQHLGCEAEGLRHCFTRVKCTACVDVNSFLLTFDLFSFTHLEVIYKCKTFGTSVDACH